MILSTLYLYLGSEVCWSKWSNCSRLRWKHKVCKKSRRSSTNRKINAGATPWSGIIFWHWSASILMWMMKPYNNFRYAFLQEENHHILSQHFLLVVIAGKIWLGKRKDWCYVRGIEMQILNISTFEFNVAVYLWVNTCRVFTTWSFLGWGKRWRRLKLFGAAFNAVEIWVSWWWWVFYFKWQLFVNVWCMKMKIADL